MRTISCGSTSSSRAILVFHLIQEDRSLLKANGTGSKIWCETKSIGSFSKSAEWSAATSANKKLAPSDIGIHPIGWVNACQRHDICVDKLRHNGRKVKALTARLAPERWRKG